MLSNFRHSLRALAKVPGFTLVAILTLAVGIGVTTAIFSALRALVISPFNYPNAEQLVHVWSDDHWSLSVADFFDLRAESKSFSGFGIYQPRAVNIGAVQAQAGTAVVCTADVLPVFGVKPALGRFFAPADELVGAPPVAIVSDSIFKSFLGGRAEAVGKTLRIDGTDVTVVGVMPAGFEFQSPWLSTAMCQIWLPYLLSDEDKRQRGNHNSLGIARLREGVSVEAADAELKTIGKRLTQAYPDTNTRKPFLVHSLRFEMTRNVGPQLKILFGAVALVLLVACGNVASMLLARQVRRQGEFGVRLALGANVRHVMGLALTESLVLAMGGAMLGIAIAWGGVHGLRLIAPVSEARKAAIALDVGALGFALGAAALTAFLAGLPPAFAATRISLANTMRIDARGSVGSRTSQRMLKTLIIAQIALAFLLANGAVMFSRSYLKLVEENQLLANDDVITGQVAFNGPRYSDNPASVRAWYELVNRVGALPGVTAVAITSKLPLEGGSNTGGLVNDESYDPAQKRLQIERSSVTENYFSAMGLRIIKGRALKSEDRVGDIPGVVVNEKLANKAWPNKSPLGEIIRSNTPGKPWFTVRVVGVVEDVRQWGAESDVQPEMYTVPEGHWGSLATLVMRSSLPKSQLSPLVRKELASIDPELALQELRTMRQVVRGVTQSQRAVAGLVDFFMAVALGLVAVGLYGTLSYHVQQRTREIGVRMAIGAAKRDVVALVFGQGSRWVAVGLVLGIGGSLALSKGLQSFLYGITSMSAGPLLLAILAVGLAAVAACSIPAFRAARLDPLVALRSN